MTTLAILEDNAERREEMSRVLAHTGSDLRGEFFPTAPSFINWAKEHLHEASLVSLDHDLEPEPGSKQDPGTGRDAADWLAQQAIRMPVIIHSSNYTAAVGMESALQEASFQPVRVPPYDDLQWIAEAWIEEVVSQLKNEKLF